MTSLHACAENASAPEAKASSSMVKRTPWGHPDISGTWEDQDDVGVPLEKPDGEVKQIETQEEAFEVADARGGKTGAGPGWWYEVRPSSRKYQLIDPADGKLPPLTAIAQERMAALAKKPASDPNNPRSFDELAVQTRCLSRGPAMLPNGFQYNNAYEITQAPDYVAIRHEMVHDVRIVPLDGRPHVSPKIRLWLGDQRGHWEGDTLVVETTNLHDLSPIPGRRGVPGGNQNVVMTERFTRRQPDVLTYEITIKNPDVYAKPWTLSVPMKNDPKYQIFEYACHEGNQAVINIVRSSRAAAAKNGRHSTR